LMTDTRLLCIPVPEGEWTVCSTS